MTLTHGMVASESNHIHSFAGAVSASLSGGGHGVIGSWRARSHVTPVSQCEGGALTAAPVETYCLRQRTESQRHSLLAGS